MLDYETQTRRYQPTPEDRQWLLRRLAYYLGLLLLFGLIVYGPGPNLFLFHSPFSPSLAHYATLTRPYVSMVAAIKAYKRDTGSLPPDTECLPKEYQPTAYSGGIGTIYGHDDVTFPAGENSVLSYDFSPANEGWIIYAPRYQGRLSLPLVPAAPSPATRPATTRNGKSNASN
jgi:hypothetical protein